MSACDRHTVLSWSCFRKQTGVPPVALRYGDDGSFQSTTSSQPSADCGL
jgi:hypothetical protein